MDGFRTLIRPAESFAGTDLLSADVFFLGCEKPGQPSFAYIAEMLKHINLAGRSCGVFSSGKKAFKYLSDLVKDCEAAVAEPFLAEGGDVSPAALKKWIQGIIKGGKPSGGKARHENPQS
ncbi:MAG: hypothetical protein LBJ90_05010 [Treponema sp.]|nr:hypothetical protein [Treponema sp.]